MSLVNDAYTNRLEDDYVALQGKMGLQDVTIGALRVDNQHLRNQLKWSQDDLAKYKRYLAIEEKQRMGWKQYAHILETAIINLRGRYETKVVESDAAVRHLMNLTRQMNDLLGEMAIVLAEAAGCDRDHPDAARIEQELKERFKTAVPTFRKADEILRHDPSYAALLEQMQKPDWWEGPESKAAMNVDACKAYAEKIQENEKALGINKLGKNAAQSFNDLHVAYAAQEVDGKPVVTMVDENSRPFVPDVMPLIAGETDELNNPLDKPKLLNDVHHSLMPEGANGLDVLSSRGDPESLERDAMLRGEIKTSLTSAGWHVKASPDVLEAIKATGERPLYEYLAARDARAALEPRVAALQAEASSRARIQAEYDQQVRQWEERSAIWEKKSSVAKVFGTAPGPRPVKPEILQQPEVEIPDIEAAVEAAKESVRAKILDGWRA